MPRPTVRAQLIRIAFDNPELRETLGPHIGLTKSEGQPRQAAKPKDPVVDALKAILAEEFGGRAQVSSPKVVKGEWGDQTSVTVKTGGKTWHVFISHEDGIASVMSR